MICDVRIPMLEFALPGESEVIEWCLAGLFVQVIADCLQNSLFQVGGDGYAGAVFHKDITAVMPEKLVNEIQIDKMRLVDSDQFCAAEHCLVFLKSA